MSSKSDLLTMTRSTRLSTTRKEKKSPVKKGTKSKQTPNRTRKSSKAIASTNLTDILREAQLRLHVGSVPETLPCREQEFDEIFCFTEAKIADGTGGCMYISGVPGTGKTATVKEVIKTLDKLSRKNDIPKFHFVEINGMRLSEPNQLYVQLWKAITGSKVTSEHAKQLLEAKFTKTKATKAEKMTVVLVDELDLLCNRKQSVLYNIFEWPTNRDAKLVILAIANTMDLPERVLMTRVSSRLGLTRLTFSPYSHSDLDQIIKARLGDPTVFEPDAIQLVARKVASLSGDARRALDICRRATEIALEIEDSDLVSIGHVDQALREMFSSPKATLIQMCSKYEKLFMQSMLAAFTKSGIEESSFDRVMMNMKEATQFENLPLLSVDEGHNVLGRLNASRLILTEPGKSGRLDMKLRLNVSPEDISYALRSEE